MFIFIWEKQMPFCMLNWQYVDVFKVCSHHYTSSRKSKVNASSWIYTLIKSRMLIRYYLGNLCHSTLEKRSWYKLHVMLLFIACMCVGVLTVIITQGSTYTEYIIDCVSYSVFIYHNIFFINFFFKSTTILQFEL